MLKPIIQNDYYKRIRIRSSPFGLSSGNGSFSRRINIFFPNPITGGERITEYVDKFVRGETDAKNFPYATLESCHKANLEWGREIVDRWIMGGKS